MTIRPGQEKAIKTRKYFRSTHLGSGAATPLRASTACAYPVVVELRIARERRRQQLLRVGHQRTNTQTLTLDGENRHTQSRHRQGDVRPPPQSDDDRHGGISQIKTRRITHQRRIRTANRFTSPSHPIRDLRMDDSGQTATIARAFYGHQGRSVHGSNRRSEALLRQHGSHGDNLGDITVLRLKAGARRHHDFSPAELFRFGLQACVSSDMLLPRRNRNAGRSISVEHTDVQWRIHRNSILEQYGRP